MKTIPLTQGKVALVDDEDHMWLNQFKWHAVKHIRKNRIVWYALRRTSSFATPPRQTIRMHREIARITATAEVDHRDGNGLNNQRKNLRSATHTQNQHNRRKTDGCSSRFKGVSWEKLVNKWRASIRVKGRAHTLGFFNSEQEAATVYDSAAKRFFGEFALPNEK